jgi:PEP-CTERM motif
MNLAWIDASPLADESDQPASGGGTCFRALLLGTTMAIGGMMASPADANQFLVTTTGVITSGSESGGLFGLGAGPTSLVGATYTLSVGFDYLGPNYFATGSGTFATDYESFPGIPGPVTATVNGQALPTSLVNSLSSQLEESLTAGYGSLFAMNSGYDGNGAFADTSQDLVCGSSNSCVPNADLMTPFSYTLIPGDTGTDEYTYQGAGFPAAGTPIANFLGTETSINVQSVPEPESWALFATGLLGLGLVARRRRA